MKNSHEKKDSEVIVTKFLIVLFKTEFSEKMGLDIKLKTAQKVAVSCLLDGADVLAVLPTGFDKSLIFQTYVIAE